MKREKDEERERGEEIGETRYREHSRSTLEESISTLEGNRRGCALNKLNLNRQLGVEN